MKTKVLNIALAALTASIALAPQVDAKIRGQIKPDSVQVRPGVVLMLTLNGPIETNVATSTKNSGDNLPNVAANDGTWSLRPLR